MLPVHLIVPIRKEKQGVNLSNPPAQVSEQVERSLIRPVGIIENDDPGSRLVEATLALPKQRPTS